MRCTALLVVLGTLFCLGPAVNAQQQGRELTQCADIKDVDGSVGCRRPRKYPGGGLVVPIHHIPITVGGGGGSDHRCSSLLIIPYRPEKVGKYYKFEKVRVCRSPHEGVPNERG